MGRLQLLAGEKEELRLHPSPATDMARRLWAVALVLWGGMLWGAFHASWWTSHTASDWTAPWTWLWGTDAAAYLWTVGGLAVGAAVACLGQVSWNRLWIGLGLGLAVAVAAATTPAPAADVLPIATMACCLLALLWVEARRLGTTYHITNLRLVVRTVLPQRTQKSLMYVDLVDIDSRPSRWADTGTLMPVLARPRVDDDEDPVLQRPAEVPGRPVSLPGVRPFGRVRALVELLARRATASERVKKETGIEAQVAEALAALHRR